MWCRHCQQDVPALGSSQTGYRCARCQQTTSIELATSATPATASTSAASESLRADESEAASTGATTRSPLQLWSGWELNEQLRHVERLLKNTQLAQTSRHASRLRVDAASQQQSFGPIDATNRSPTASGSASAAAVLGWLFLGAGVGATACGAVLSVWGYLAGRADLMRVGIPTMIAGQFGLVAGLLLQMLSRRSTAATSPPSLAQQIHELRKASELLNAARS